MKLEVVHDVRMGLVQGTSRRVMAIALLGHGQGDDPRLRRAHRLEELLDLPRRDDHLPDRADDPERLAGLGAHREGIEPVLRIEGIVGVGTAQACGDDSPARIVAEDIVRIDGLMRPVEGPDAEMHDPGLYRLSIIGWTANAFRQIGKRVFVQAIRHSVLKVWSIKVLRLLPSPLWGGIKGGGVGAGPSLG